MKKIYVLKLSNKEGKELFNGEIVRQIIVGDKIYNLVGSGLESYESAEEVIVCSAKTQKELKYARIGQIYFKVDNNTKHRFMVLK